MFSRSTFVSGVHLADPDSRPPLCRLSWTARLAFRSAAALAQGTKERSRSGSPSRVPVLPCSSSPCNTMKCSFLVPGMVGVLTCVLMPGNCGRVSLGAQKLGRSFRMGRVMTRCFVGEAADRSQPFKGILFYLGYKRGMQASSPCGPEMETRSKAGMRSQARGSMSGLQPRSQEALAVSRVAELKQPRR